MVSLKAFLLKALWDTGLIFPCGQSHFFQLELAQTKVRKFTIPFYRTKKAKAWCLWDHLQWQRKVHTDDLITCKCNTNAWAGVFLSITAPVCQERNWVIIDVWGSRHSMTTIRTGFKSNQVIIQLRTRWALDHPWRYIKTYMHISRTRLWLLSRRCLIYGYAYTENETIEKDIQSDMHIWQNVTTKTHPNSENLIWISIHKSIFLYHIQKWLQERRK